MVSDTRTSKNADSSHLLPFIVCVVFRSSCKFMFLAINVWKLCQKSFIISH